MKTVSLHLAFRPVPQDYEVVRITNSTDYHPGQVLKKEEVTQLCKAKGWNVQMGGK